MEISKEFAEKQYLLHKQEADKWSKIVKTFDNTTKKGLTKKEREIMASNLIDAHHSRRRKKKTTN